MVARGEGGWWWEGEGGMVVGGGGRDGGKRGREGWWWEEMEHTCTYVWFMWKKEREEELLFLYIYCFSAF